MIIERLKDWASGGPKTIEEVKANTHRLRAEKNGHIIDILSEMADRTNEDHTERSIQRVIELMKKDKESEERWADYYDGEMSWDELIEEEEKELEEAVEDE